VDVEAWLNDLGLGQYGEAFGANDIDGETLPSLDGDDLKELGVASLGHRKKLLAAIERLGDGNADVGPEAPHESLPGERRQVTILFADIAGFTRLSTERDAEDVHAMLNEYVAAVDGVVQRYGGTVDKHIGDAVMAVFGAPVAHSDDPERAVRAALDIHAAVAALEPPQAVHVGIASGEVVASGTGSDQHREYTVTGDSVNLASRLQDLAGTGETLISDAVRHAAPPGLRAVPLDDVEIKGIASPIRVWGVTALLTDADPSSGVIVGRTGKLAQFSGVLGACRASGHGQVVHVRGEAGIGKSRLLEEFRSIARREGFAGHSGRALDFGVGRGRDAIATIVRGLLGLAEDTDDVARTATSNEKPERQVHLNDLLDIAQPDELRAIHDAMDNETRVRGRSATVVDLARASAAEQPLMITVEGVHWANSTVLIPLTEIAALAGESRIILVMTSRIEGDPIDQAWRGMARGCPLMTIDLGPLRPADAMELAQSRLDGDSAFIKHCIERAEGNPLFLDQLLRGGEEKAGQAIPGSVQSIVLARIDSLGAEDRRAIQAASVIGQRFSLDALRHIVEHEAYRCDGLVERALVRPDESGFSFSHALVRDGVYASLLGEAKRALHRRAATWFEDSDAALHAEHLGRARDPDAPRVFLATAEQLAADHRYERALQLVEQGMALAIERSDKFALTCRRAELLQNLGDASASIDAYQASLDHADDDPGRCQAWIGIAAGIRLQGGREEGLEALDKAQHLTQPEGFEHALARIHHIRGNFHFGGGEIEPCMEQQQLALEYAERAGDLEWQARVLSGLGDAYYARCRMRTSLAYFQRCIAPCREHGFISIEAANLSLVGNTRRYINEWDGAIEDVLAATELAHRVGNRRAELIGSMLIGEFFLERGRYENVEAPLNDAMVWPTRSVSFPSRHIS